LGCGQGHFFDDGVNDASGGADANSAAVSDGHDNDDDNDDGDSGNDGFSWPTVMRGSTNRYRSPNTSQGKSQGQASAGSWLAGDPLGPAHPAADSKPKLTSHHQHHQEEILTVSHAVASVVFASVRQHQGAGGGGAAGGALTLPDSWPALLAGADYQHRELELGVPMPAANEMPVPGAKTLGWSSRHVAVQREHVP
jgi:hypothetical protein